MKPLDVEVILIGETPKLLSVTPEMLRIGRQYPGRQGQGGGSAEARRQTRCMPLVPRLTGTKSVIPRHLRAWQRASKRCLLDASMPSTENRM